MHLPVVSVGYHLTLRYRTSPYIGGKVFLVRCGSNVVLAKEQLGRSRELIQSNGFNSPSTSKVRIKKEES